MKVPISWLKDFININISIEELVNKLVNIGLEVEEIIYTADQLKNIVSGKIISIKKHPNADKLSICDISIKDKNVVIVTGATNIKEGNIVPVALDGSTIYGGKTINCGELRGVMSEGMLCGGSELGLDRYDYPTAEVDGIMILDDNTPIGVDINNIVGNDDIILDIGVTANRPDCNSILGIAREIAAITNESINIDSMLKYNAEIDKSPVSVEVKSTNCPQYIAKYVEDIIITDSPSLIAKRLKKVGLRPINNIVDLTNYILIELGQPMHAFDKDMVDKLVIRNAQDGEKIVALNDIEYTLDDTMLVIADSVKPLAIGGIMGGVGSGISNDTHSIILESAKFLRENIRRTSRKLNLRSDSSSRFEKGIDYESQQLAIDRACNIISCYGWGKISKSSTVVTDKVMEEKIIAFTSEEITKILGIVINESKILDILNSLNIKTTINNGIFNSIAPLYREDLECANDIAEELIRIYGYDNITSTLMDSAKQTIGGINPHNQFYRGLRAALIGNGYNEIITYSFTTPKYLDNLMIENSQPIRLKNALGEELSAMRTTLAHSMLTTISSNVNKGIKQGKLYEYARVYIPDSLPLTKLPQENNTLIIAQFNNESVKSGLENGYYEIKNTIELLLSTISNIELKPSSVPYMHPGRSADIYILDQYVGYMGEIHPKVMENYDLTKPVYIAELNIDKLYEIKSNMDGYKYVSISKYPSIERDFALVLKDEINAQDILNTVYSCGGEYLVSAKVFDVYYGAQLKKGYKSIAINTEFKANKTLTEQEISLTMDTILNTLKDKYNARIRD